MALAGLLTLAATACAGPDQFAPAPALSAVSAHPLAAPAAPGGVVPSDATATVAVPAPSAGGAAVRLVVPPWQAATTRASRPIGKPAASVSPSPAVSVKTLGPAPRRRRPGWIQSLFHGNPGQWCDEEPVSETDNERAFTVERLASRTVCFDGFAEMPAPQLYLTAPDGAESSIPADTPGSGFEYEKDFSTWGWSIRPGLIGGQLNAVGTYRFELSGPPKKSVAARGANLILQGRITVVPGAEARVAISYHPKPEFDSRTINAGGKVAVQFSGYQPGSRVFVTIYGPDPAGEGLRPQADLPDVVIGGNGEGIAWWTSSTTAVPGEYGIWVESPHGQPSGCVEELCQTFTVDE